jgi:hypothetical protein
MAIARFRIQTLSSLPILTLSIPSFSSANPRFSLTIEKKRKNILTFSAPHSSLSAVNKTLRQKLASFLAMAITYAVLGYAFFFVFFRSQF